MHDSHYKTLLNALSENKSNVNLSSLNVGAVDLHSLSDAELFGYGASLWRCLRSEDERDASATGERVSDPRQQACDGAVTEGAGV